MEEGMDMTKIACMAAAFLTIAGVSFAAEQTWTGVISDTMCAKSHQSNIEHALENSGKRMTDQECTVGCVMRRGQKYVFVSNRKIYQIENQDYAGLAAHAAHPVKVRGSLAGDTIRVSQIVMTEKGKGE
jgi:hypothetical protein